MQREARKLLNCHIAEQHFCHQRVHVVCAASIASISKVLAKADFFQLCGRPNVCNAIISLAPYSAFSCSTRFAFWRRSMPGCCLPAPRGKPEEAGRAKNSPAPRQPSIIRWKMSLERARSFWMLLLRNFLGSRISQSHAQSKQIAYWSLSLR